MINPFKEITEYQGKNIFDLLSNIDLDMLFEPLREVFLINEDVPDIRICNQAVKFIVYCYSSESDKITIGGDRRREKAAVFALLDMDGNLYNDFVVLENEAVIEVVQAWLRRQKNHLFEYWITLREVYVQQQTAALKPLQNGDGGIDYNQKQKCVEHMADLKKMMKEAEAEVHQNDPMYKTLVEDVKKHSPKSTTIGPENFSI